ncbi:MAG: hypothetical protein OHK0011_03280 [Turneriella sp.]
MLFIVMLCATGISAEQKPAAPERAKEAATVEIGLATGKVIVAKIVQRSPKEIVYRLSTSTEETKLSLQEVIFIRSTDGAYEFIFPEEKPEEMPADGQTATPAPTAARSATENLFLVGVGVTLSDNSALTTFANDYAQALAADYNARLSPAGFVAQPGLDAAHLNALFSAEYRWLRGDYAIGLFAGYSILPKSSAVVSSAAYSGQETVNVDGYALPVTAILYYRIWGDRSLGFNLGAGGGALFTSVLMTRNFGSKSAYEEARGLAPMLLLRPEFALRIGSVNLIAALPIFWAEGRPVGHDISATQASGRVAAASFTGAGLQLAVGYEF